MVLWHRDCGRDIPGRGSLWDWALPLAGAMGLVLPTTRRAAGICLALLFMLMLPANIHAALAGVVARRDGHSPGNHP
ncbi:hypothetical protein Misp02_22610 [Microtetraspora sp. NBRC 16547]|nr:hypothetical protein Misp02_22610 [Microtetraspora sp. NBRC 16547]